MSNKHVNHQHGLTTMNASRPKSKLYKRKNKAKAKDRKEVLLTALKEAVIAGRSTGAKPAKAAPKAEKAAVKTEKVVELKPKTTKKEEKEKPVKAEQTSIAG